jgi:hypothetical protein
VLTRSPLALSPPEKSKEVVQRYATRHSTLATQQSV